MLKTPTACRHLMRASNAAASFMTGPSSLLTSDSSPGSIMSQYPAIVFGTSRFPKKSLTACNWVGSNLAAKHSSQVAGGFVGGGLLRLV